MASGTPDLPRTEAIGDSRLRWAFAFGIDNMDRRRKDGQAFRLGVDVTSLGFLRLIDPVPFLNSVSGIVDVNHNGSVDRYGFSVGFGFGFGF